MGQGGVEPNSGDGANLASSPPDAHPQQKRILKSKIRLICLVYLLGLSILLLVPDPLALLGLHQKLRGLPRAGLHFLLFTMLGLLAAASRLPLRRALLSAALVGYATAIELLQSLVPPRTVQLQDWIENLLGLGCGTLVWMAVSAGFRCPPQDH